MRRYGKRRPRGSGEITKVQVYVSLSAKEKLDALAGEESLSWAFEQLVEREMNRRIRRYEKMNTSITGNDSSLITSY